MEIKRAPKTFLNFASRALGAFFAVILPGILSGCSSSHPMSQAQLKQNTAAVADLEGIAPASPLKVSKDSNSASDQSAEPDSELDSDDLLPSNSPQGNSPQEPAKSPQPQELSYHNKKTVTRSASRITVGEALSGTSSDSKNSSTSFVPASITKMITSGLALEFLGPEFRFTHVWSYQRVPGSSGEITNFKWVADGDPTLNNEKFLEFGRRQMPTLREQVLALKQRGITAVHGALTLVASDPRLDKKESAPGVQDSDRRTCFGAYALAFNFARNCSPHGPIANTKSYLQTQLLHEFQFVGIRYVADDLKGEGDPESLTFYSPTLKEMIIPMNKESDNLLADSLFRAMALRAASPDQDLLEAGRDLYEKTLSRWLREDGVASLAKELTFFDGSGLSRDDRATPRAFLSVLKHYINKSYFPYLWASMPIAGVDGTLRHRLQGKETKGLVRAKTGTVVGYYQLAGYIPRMKNDEDIKELVPFVILTQTPDGSYMRVAHQYQDELVSRLAHRVNP
jgi:D-alanyl-D-alanine carboxypeptidase